MHHIHMMRCGETFGQMVHCFTRRKWVKHRHVVSHEMTKITPFYKFLYKIESFAIFYVIKRFRNIVVINSSAKGGAPLKAFLS